MRHFRAALSHHLLQCPIVCGEEEDRPVAGANVSGEVDQSHLRVPHAEDQDDHTRGEEQSFVVQKELDLHLSFSTDLENNTVIVWLAKTYIRIHKMCGNSCMDKYVHVHGGVYINQSGMSM